MAQRFKALQADGEEKQHLLWMLRKREALGEQERHQRAVGQAQVDTEAQTAQLRHVEAELETMRAAHYAASDNMHAAQGALYEANAEVSKLEAEIRYVVESRNRVQAQIAALSAQGEQWRDKPSLGGPGAGRGRAGAVRGTHDRGAGHPGPAQ